MGVLVLGTWDSYGTEQLLLRHGPEWEGLAIDATFHNVPNDEGVDRKSTRLNSSHRT